MADSITTRSDAEAAGWRIVHEGVDPSNEDSTTNAEVWRAEKYMNEVGRAGRFVEAQAVTEEKLYEAIAFREQQFSVSEEGDVFVPIPGETADTSDDTTFERISSADAAGAAQNDVLTVLSDPEDPESDPEQKIIRGGVEVDATEAEVTPESLTEVTPGSTQSETAANQASAATIAELQSQRDGDPGNSGNDPEVVQPPDGTATGASDSEQQSQAPDSEAATSDAVSTNADDNLATAGQPQTVTTGPDTDAEAPAAAPNAQPNPSTSTDIVETPTQQ
jgi:hypothetical protein